MANPANTGNRVSVRNLSAQPGVSRLAWSGDAVLKYKANLTALSQSANLYFIALKETVYVDRPAFPSQGFNTGSGVHELRWRISRSRSQATSGFHNRRYPHAINRLELDFLGTQEVLTCACDDGDVLVYNVSGITAAFDSIDNGVPQSQAIDKYVKAALVYNVGISAWGLAMQREARLIAVSSNDHNVHIFATALGQLPDSPSGQDDLEILSIQAPGQVEALDRGMEISWRLNAHSTNIPNVAFYTHRSDDTEIFLLSSDIDSTICIWNITKGSQLVHKISPNQVDNSRQYGWISVPVPIECFRLVTSNKELHKFAAELNCFDEASLTSDTSSRGLIDLPCPVMHTRSHQVSLITHSQPPNLADFLSPWREHERGAPFEGPQMDYGTLKYARCIPELGVVVTASDAGYAGVFTLTRLQVGSSTQPDSTMLGMRLDHILPLDEQVPSGIHELRGLNLWSGLIGIATAPMQGSKKKRFRLILEYGDRTVLSYELSRDDRT